MKYNKTDTNVHAPSRRALWSRWSLCCIVCTAFALWTARKRRCPVCGRVNNPVITQASERVSDEKGEQDALADVCQHCGDKRPATDGDGVRGVSLQLEYKAVIRPQCSASNNCPVPGSDPHRPAYYIGNWITHTDKHQCQQNELRARATCLER